MSDLLHASAVAFQRRGVLILGPSGAGKSGLALELISRGATLVSDDQVCLTGNGPDLRISPPEAIKGLIEARGIGLMRLPFVVNVAPVVVVDLERDSRQRMPQCNTITLKSACLPLIAGANVPNLAAAIAAGVNLCEEFPLYRSPMDGQADETRK